MKIFYLSMLVFFLFACQSNQNNSTSNIDSLETKTNDSLLNLETVYLENLLNIDEDELIKRYGKENITLDTIWGAEGMFYIGTKLFAKTPKEVIISWSDTLNHSKIVSLTINSGYNNATGEYLLYNYWKSKTGISLGTSLKELVELNGANFKFYGLGWDYGGEVISWNDGKLDKAGIAITLGTINFDNQPDAYNKIVGDQEFSSSNSNAIKVNPIVLVLTVINLR